MITYMWQELYGEPYFRFQTDEPKVAKKMRQRKNFVRVGYGINTQLWIYRTTFYKPQDAKRTLRNITGREIQKDAENGLFYA